MTYSTDETEADLDDSNSYDLIKSGIIMIIAGLLGMAKYHGLDRKIFEAANINNMGWLRVSFIVITVIGVLLLLTGFLVEIIL